MTKLESITKALEICSHYGSMCGTDCRGYQVWSKDGRHIETINEHWYECPYNNCETGCVKTLARDALGILNGLDYPNFDGTNLNPNDYVRVGDVIDCLSEIPMENEMLMHVEGLITWAIGKRAVNRDELLEYLERDFEERVVLDE